MSGIQAPPGFREMRLVLLQHGGLASLTGKTGLAMLRHRAGPIVAVIDPDHAGQSLQRVTGIERDVPVVADLAAALPYEPEVAVVGLAPSGGRLPDPVRHDALAALRAGLHLASGLHTRLANDPELAEACWSDRWIWDLRREPEGLNVGQARAAALPCRRFLAVGTDMAVGKMSACLSLLEAAQRSGIPARFVGTGQAGILISGEGVALDAVRIDYAAGAVEAAVLRAADALPEQGLVLVEGQGSLCHPASTATLPCCAVPSRRPCCSCIGQHSRPSTDCLRFLSPALRPWWPPLKPWQVGLGLMGPVSQPRWPLSPSTQHALMRLRLERRWSASVRPWVWPARIQSAGVQNLSWTLC